MELDGDGASDDYPVDSVCPTELNGRIVAMVEALEAEGLLAGSIGRLTASATSGPLDLVQGVAPGMVSRPEPGSDQTVTVTLRAPGSVG